MPPVTTASVQLKLEGGSLLGSGDVLIGSSAGLIGPGTVAGVVMNRGLATFGSRGLLFVNGSYRQESGGQLTIRFATTGRDRVEVSGPATLAGTLALAGTVTAVAKPTTVLQAASRAGTFAVTGLPSWTKMVYTTKEVKVAPK